MAPLYPFNPFSHRALSLEQVQSYLVRLKLPLELAGQAVSVAEQE